MKEKSELEQLLNSLIEKGWKPFGSYKDIITRYKYDNRFFEFNHEGDNMVSIRELVSKESGLWQFVCKNKLFPKNRGHKRENDLGCGVKFYEDEPEYYIIECALLEEGELEDFLLSNIKVEGLSEK